MNEPLSPQRGVSRRGAFSLDEPGKLWFVSSGYLDLFAVAREGHPGAAALQHVGRATPGHCVTNLAALVARGIVFDVVAVPAPGSDYSRCEQAEFGELFATDADWNPAAALLQTVWDAGQQLPQGRRPDNFEHLVPGTSATLESGTHAACDTGTALVEIASGEAHFLGDPDARLGQGATLLLPKHAWLTAAGAGEWRAYSAEATGDLGTLIAAFGEFFASTVRFRCALIAARDQEEFARLQTRIDTTERALADGMHRMLRLLDSGASAPGGGRPHARLALLEACKLIGDQLAVEFKIPADLPGDIPLQMQRISDASNVRVRQVTLSGADWYRRDEGPMLCFDAETQAPRALIPGRGKRYQLHNAAEGTSAPMNELAASRLMPFAYIFYRPLPNRPLNFLDLLKFGAHGLGREAGYMVGLAGLMGLLALVAPLASAALIDDVIPSAQSHLLVQLGILLFVVAVSQSLFAVARNQLVLRIQDKMDLAIQAAIWDRVLNLPITFFRDYSVADLAARVNSINAMHRMLSVGTMTSLLNGLFSFLSFIVLFRFSAPLAFTALALLAGAGLALFIFGWLTLRVLKNMVASQRRINNLILQFLQGVAKLRATASEARAFSIWAKESTHMRDIALKILKLRTVERVFFSGYEHAGTVALFAVMGALIGADSHRTLSAGEFVGFYAAFVNVFQGTLGICQTLVGLMMLVPLYQMAKSILQAVPEDDAGKTHPGTLSGAIEVSQVYFSYPDGEPVLANVSLQVRPGSFTAIVGPSGSGKSTLLRLLLGFEMPTSGAVLYDDKNLQDLNLRAVRQQFGVVLQNSQLMGGDIFSNIAGTSNASIDDAWDAARQSGLDADVQLMPMGMHTAIGEGSSTLSGGQRQRVLISRALVGRPRILYFDEATSALDNRSQAVVSESLMRLKTTRIVVAHRLSTVIHADQIIVLDGGQIVEAGSYAELMEKNGLFAELARRQLAEAA